MMTVTPRLAHFNCVQLFCHVRNIKLFILLFIVGAPSQVRPGLAFRLSNVLLERNAPVFSFSISMVASPIFKSMCVNLTFQGGGITGTV